jgi:hypothetical protein
MSVNSCNIKTNSEEKTYDSPPNYFNYNNRTVELTNYLCFFDNENLNGQSFFLKEIDYDIDSGIPITDGLFDDLINQSIIIDSQVIMERPISDSINKRIYENLKDNTKLSYLGSVQLNKNFKSYLIFEKMRNTDGFSKSWTIYLINVKDNILKSITEVASFFAFDGESQQANLEKLPNNYFQKVTRYLSSDCIIIGKPDYMYPRDKSVSRPFYFDSNGFLIEK